MKSTKTSSIIALIIFAILLFIISSNLSTAKKPTCGTFPTRYDAQKAYDLDPTAYKSLDKGSKNGIVCESYNYN